MEDTRAKKYENTIENATNFLSKEDKRKAPNNRVRGLSFFQISNQGADRLMGKLKKE